MKITDQILKKNRERKGVSLSEVSLATKITIKTLAAIESGDPATLPPKTFLRGFVRSYAVFLGVDVDEILRTFHEEMGSTLSRPVTAGPNPSELNSAATEAISGGAVEPKSQGDLSAPSPRDIERGAPPVERRAAKRVDAEARLRDETSLMTKGGIFGGILLLIVLIVFLKGKMDSYESERTSPAEPATVETVAPPTGAPLVAGAAPESQDDEIETRDGDGGGPAAPTAAEIAALAATPTPTPKPTATPTPTPKPTATPTPTPKPTATPTPTPKPTATPTPTPKPTATPTPTPGAAPTPKPVGAAPAGKSHEILIEALDQVDVEVTVDGEPPRTIKLKGEQIQSLKVKRKATLKLSDGGAVNLIVNGLDRGVPGDLGKPTRVELP